MSDLELERVITIASLINAAFFYFVVIIVFLMARKTRLNLALASQKLIWFIIITVLTLPLVIWRKPLLPSHVRAGIWLLLAVSTWWVLYEVYKANWPWGIRAFIADTWLEAKRLPGRIWHYVSSVLHLT